MATNVSLSEQRIWHCQQQWPPDVEPSIYHGFYISTTSDSFKVYPFESPEQRTAFVEAIGRAAPNLDNYDRFLIATIAALGIFDSIEHGDWLDEKAEAYGFDADAVREAAEQFADAM
jgi:hypothetical protein